MNYSHHLIAGLSLFAGFIQPLTAQSEPEVLVVSETFGRSLEETRPTKVKPIYYYLLGGAQLDIGGKIKGEKMPAKTDLDYLVHHTLASQGFRRAQEGGVPPELIVTYAYGSVAVDLVDWPEETIDLTVEDAVDTSEYSSTNEYANGGQILQLIGASKMQNQRMDLRTTQRFNTALHYDRLYITVSAMGAEALLRQQREIIWRTKISIELDRNNLPDAMNVMMASAAPYIGIETDVPVFMDKRDRRNSEVQIGELEVVESDPR
jgi:hypothetical protein